MSTTLWLGLFMVNSFYDKYVTIPDVHKMYSRVHCTSTYVHLKMPKVLIVVNNISWYTVVVVFSYVHLNFWWNDAFCIKKMFHSDQITDLILSFWVGKLWPRTVSPTANHHWQLYIYFKFLGDCWTWKTT